MIGLVQPDRWTCPTCLVTEVPQVAEADLNDAIRRLQLLHAHEHGLKRQPNADAIE